MTRVNTVSDAASKAPGHGAARVAAICETAVRAIVSFRPLRQFVRQDPEYALRLLVSKIGPVQRRSIDRVRQLLQAEAALGLVLPLGVDTLAYLIVRLCESFIYADVISDQKVDVGDAGLAVQLLLSGRVAGVASPYNSHDRISCAKRNGVWASSRLAALA